MSKAFRASTEVDVDLFDTDALYAELLLSHATAVYRYVYGVVGNRSLADDLTQDAFMRAFEHIGELRSVASSRPWLFAIASNVVRQHLRRTRFRRWLPLAGLRQPAALTVAPADEPSDTSIFVTEVLHRLDEPDREILLPVGLLEFTQREAAAVLRISESAAQKRWQRSCARFVRIANEGKP